MFTVTIDTRYIEKAELLFRDHPRRLSAALRIAMRNTIIEIMFRLKSLVPVKTGTLRRSWQAKELKQGPDGVGWIGGMGSNLSYAAAVEFGKHQPEQVRTYTRRARGSAGCRRHPPAVYVHARIDGLSGQR